jgi:transposase
MPGSPIAAHRDIRFRWYLQVEKHGKTIQEVCDLYGMSKKTYCKWYRKDHGLGSNDYRPRKAHPGTKITPCVKNVIIESKEKYNYGPEKMKRYVKRELDVEISSTAIYKFYRKQRLIRKPQKKQPWYKPMKKKIEAKRPGQNVQLDVKYVPGTESRWEYQSRFIDTLTNMQHTFQELNRSAETSIHVFKQAERSFPFPIHGIQTDNGGEFRGVFAEYLKSRGIIQRFIPKRSAPWNGKVERANRSVDDEYYLNPTRPWNTVEEYTKWYNEKRIHLGRGMHGMTPLERYQQYLKRRQIQLPLKVN